VVGVVVVATFLADTRTPIRVVLVEVVVIGMDKGAQLPARILQHLLGIRVESLVRIVTMEVQGLVVVAQVETDTTPSTET